MAPGAQHVRIILVFWLYSWVERIFSFFFSLYHNDLINY
ncbi:hypothetical protein EPYR_00629 [Erwinia pyrifoliae DSM 12163]|nr:hypothetical protein EPYR_00629 [Erwinia pyrifoliae DSM 12163]